MPTPTDERRRRRRRTITALAVVNVVLLLFPPLQWWVADGSAGMAIGYFVVTGLIAVASVLVIHRLDASGEDDAWTS